MIFLNFLKANAPGQKHEKKDKNSLYKMPKYFLSICTNNRKKIFVQNDDKKTLDFSAGLCYNISGCHRDVTLLTLFVTLL